ncbi:MAG TPA: serine hydrolase domain-containing protein [Microthrixaceae bacterium]|nr:serine hydrolase domain-containing protein [Microthrixaceae bacterium]
MSPMLPSATKRLEALVADGLFAVGAQLWVSHRGDEICDHAVGDAVAGPMTPATVHNCYCMGRPLTGLAIGSLWADGQLDPTRPISTLGLPEWAVPPFECSTLDVLDHQVGLDGLPAMEYRITPAPARTDLVRVRLANAKPRPAYSEILGGIVLEEVIRAATGCDSVADELRRSVLEPLGVERIALDAPAARHLAAEGSVSVPIGGLPTRQIPLLYELLDSSFTDLRPAFGVLCSARDIGRALEGIRGALTADPALPHSGPPVLRRDMLERLIAPRHPAFDDARVMRTMNVAGGFMVDARVNELGRHASPRSYGHHGGMAPAVTFTDLDHDLTVSIYLNGAEVGPPTARLECLTIVDDVYRDLGLT